MKNLFSFPQKAVLKFVFQDNVESGDVVTQLSDEEKKKLLEEEKEKIIQPTENALSTFIESELREKTIQQIRERVEGEIKDWSREDQQAILEKLATPDIITACIALQKGGITVDGDVMDSLTPEKITRGYINALISLQKGGVNVDGHTIYFLAKEKITPDYINALISLQKGGVKVDGEIIREFKKEKTTPDYVNALILLQKEGIEISPNLIYCLTKEKITPAFINAFIILQKGDIAVSGSIIRMLTKEKITKEFLNAFVTLQKGGVKVDFSGSLIGALTKEKTTSTSIKAFIALQAGGISVDGFLISYLTKEKITPAFINAFVALKQGGIKFDLKLIDTLTKEKTDPAFISAFINLKKAGIKIDSEIIYAFTKEKTDPEFINTFIALHEGGININNGTIYYLTKEKTAPEFINAFIDLHEGGITVDTPIIEFFTKEKTAPEFINAFIALHEGGIEIDIRLIMYFTKEKNTSEFISTFLRLQKEGITVNASLISSFTKEKNIPKFIDVLLMLQKRGITVNGQIIENLTLKKAKDSFYIDVLIAEGANFFDTDKRYIQHIFQFELDTTVNNLKQLLELKTSPKATPVAKQIITEELKSALLRSVREMNHLHEESHERRLEEVKDFSVELLYESIVLGNEEVFTSTFTILFDEALMPTLKNDSEYQGNGYNLLQKVNREGMRTFLRTCAQYNKLQNFLDTMDKSQQTEILKAFASNLDTTNNQLAEAVTLGETLVYILAGQNETLQVLESTIKSEYERLEKSNPDAARLYGLIASTHAKTATTEQAWFESMQEKYKIPDLSRIESKELFLEEKVNVQQHFFYDDTEGGLKPPSQWDGHNSFRHFLQVYGGSVLWDKDGTNVQVTGEGRDGWSIEDKGSYVSLKKERKNGKQIEIYANKPDQEDGGPEAIQKSFEAMNLKSIVIVHRGHSYHADKTIERIPDIARIVNMGSCGGFNNMSAVLNRAPNAHVLATKGTGSMLVNDVLFKRINERVLTGEDMHWPTFWAEMERDFAADTSEGGKKAYEYFQAYIPPHKNIGTQIIRAYNSPDE